jgi:hypothetical protein
MEEPTRTISTKEEAEELLPILRTGLPVTLDNAGDHLPNLLCVLGRAHIPASRLSRVEALDKILREIALEMGDGPDGQAIRILLAVDRIHQGTTKGLREQRAGQVLSCGPDRVRKFHAPRLLGLMSERLHQLTMKYRPRRKEGPPDIDIAEDWPDLSTADLTEYEEIMSRVMSKTTPGGPR